jgi:hypothetical protein
MGMKFLYFTWFMITLATLWDIRRTHRFMQVSLEHIEQAARDITRYLGSERQ